MSSIVSLEPRRRTTVGGEIRAVHSYERPYRRTEAELDDGTGVVILRFLGRCLVPGLDPGLRLVAEGTPSAERAGFVMVNPLYSFEPAE